MPRSDAYRVPAQVHGCPIRRGGSLEGPSRFPQRRFVMLLIVRDPCRTQIVHFSAAPRRRKGDSEYAGHRLLERLFDLQAIRALFVGGVAGPKLSVKRRREFGQRGGKRSRLGHRGEQS